MPDRDRLTDVTGVAVGHWTDPVARTGCTVVLLPEGTVASGEVRGGAPASREVALLDPSKMVDAVDAVVLTGGSAFGLASADGVMAWLEERDRGWAAPAGVVPIVPTLGLYDLMVGDPLVRPGPAEGRTACDAATTGYHEVGPVGAGTGCTVDKWRGAEAIRPGGLVAASERLRDVVVTALVAVNAVGSVGADAHTVADILRSGVMPLVPPLAVGNTTIGVLVTNARLDKAGCHLLAQSAHHGLARAVFPSHTRSDGDAFVVAATGEHEAGIDELRILATAAVERAVLGLA
ncbi:MAG: P1 family peptidase [Aquihabitans sp.]